MLDRWPDLLSQSDPVCKKEQQQQQRKQAPERAKLNISPHQKLAVDNI